MLLKTDYGFCHANSTLAIFEQLLLWYLITLGFSTTTDCPLKGHGCSLNTLTQLNFTDVGKCLGAIIIIPKEV